MECRRSASPHVPVDGLSQGIFGSWFRGFKQVFGKRNGNEPPWSLQEVENERSLHSGRPSSPLNLHLDLDSTYKYRSAIRMNPLLFVRGNFCRKQQLHYQATSGLLSVVSLESNLCLCSNPPPHHVIESFQAVRWSQRLFPKDWNLSRGTCRCGARTRFGSSQVGLRNRRERRICVSDHFHGSADAFAV